MKRIVSLVLIVLAIIMLSLWIRYISLQFDVEKKNSGQLDSEYWIFSETSDTNIKVVADEYFFSPLSVSLILSGEGHTSAYNSHLTNVLYSSHKPLIREILSSSYLCSPAQISDWENALLLDDFVLIDYPSAFPYTVIGLFCEKTEDFPNGEVAKIKSLILYSDENENLKALSKDDRGNIFSYSLVEEDNPSLIYDFNSNNLAAYTVNKGFTNFVFNFNAKDGQKNKKLPPEYKLLSTAPNLKATSVSFPLNDTFEALNEYEDFSYSIFDKDPFLPAVFDAFEINSNIVGYYSDHFFENYFVGEKIMLAINASGALNYSATDKNAAPVTVASLLNSERTDFTVNDIITAATIFLGKFPSSMISQGATPILDGVSYSSKEDELILTFSYYYELCQVLNNGKKAQLTLTFGNNALVKAELLPVDFALAAGTLPESDYLDASIDPGAILKILDYDGEFDPVYNITQDKTVLPVWAEKVEGGNTLK